MIVVDDGEQNSTRDLVERIATELPTLNVCYLRDGLKRGPAAARNSGWRSGSGVFVAFTDDDCVPDPQWLRAGTAALLCGADAVSGKIIVPLPHRPTDYQRSAADLAKAEFATANAFLRRSVLDRLGGFDETFRAAWREDSDLHFRLLIVGKAITHSPGAKVLHPVRPADWGVSLCQERKTRYDALLRNKFPQLYEAHLPAYPVWYYFHAASLLGTLLIAFPELRIIGQAAFCAWLISTVRFAFVRLKRNSRTVSHLLEMFVTSALLPIVSLYWHWHGRWEFRHIHVNEAALPGDPAPLSHASVATTSSAPML